MIVGHVELPGAAQGSNDIRRGDELICKSAAMGHLVRFGAAHPKDLEGAVGPYGMLVWEWKSRSRVDGGAIIDEQKLGPVFPFGV